MELDYLILYVEDVEGVAAWYRDRLGLDPDVETPSFARLRDERGVGVAIHEGEPLAHPERIQLEYRVGDVEATYDRLRAAGVEFPRPPGGEPRPVLLRHDTRPGRAHGRTALGGRVGPRAGT